MCAAAEMWHWYRTMGNFYAGSKINNSSVIAVVECCISGKDTFGVHRIIMIVKLCKRLCFLGMLLMQKVILKIFIAFMYMYIKWSNFSLYFLISRWCKNLVPNPPVFHDVRGLQCLKFLPSWLSRIISLSIAHCHMGYMFPPLASQTIKMDT